MARRKPVLLLTRPHKAAQSFARRLPAAILDAVDPVMAPLVAIEPVVQVPDLEDARGVIFSSATAVALVGQQPVGHQIPAFCVGPKTTNAAQNAGWRAEMAGHTADELVAHLVRQPDIGPLLHLRGRHSRGNIAERLTQAGIRTRAQVIYEQRELPLSPDAQHALSEQMPIICPLFSPLAARHFANLVVGRPGLYLIALSEEVAKPLRNMEYTLIATASAPTGDAMIAKISHVIDQLCRVEGDNPAE